MEAVLALLRGVGGASTGGKVAALVRVEGVPVWGVAA